MRRRLIGAAIAALALAVAPTVAASATGSHDEGGGGGGYGTYVSIDQYADWNVNGAVLDVGLHVRCYGGAGLASVTVDQPNPPSPLPGGGHATGINNVNCDGHTYAVGVTVGGTPFAPGKALATATVGSVTVKRWITILVV